MVLARWSGNPLTLPTLFDTWFGTPATSFRAPVDVRRTETGYRVEAALPGFKPEDIEVTLENGTLTLGATRSEESKTENGRYLHREFYAGSFQRRLTLPDGVTAEDVSASYENGILAVDVRFDPARNTTRIPVAAATTREAMPEPQAEA